MQSRLENKMEANTNGINENAYRMENDMKKEMKANTNGIKEEMKEEMKEMRGEMQQIGRSLQAGIKAIVCSETRTSEKKNGDATCWDERAEGECTGG